MKKRIIISFLLFSFFLIPGLCAGDSIADLVSPDEDFTKLFPPLIKVSGTAFSCNNAVSGLIEFLIYNYPKKGQIEMKVSSSITTATVIINKNLGPVYSETRFPQSVPEVIKKSGHDWRIYSVNTGEDKKEILTLTLFSNKKEKKKKSFTLDRETFPTDTTMLLCHALLLKGIKKDFIFNFISLDDVMQIKANMTYHYTNDPLSLSKDFFFPRGIEMVVLPEETYHVYEMKIRGMLQLIVRSHWYFVFQTTYPYHFVAYWGGDGKGAETIYITDQEHITEKE